MQVPRQQVQPSSCWRHGLPWSSTIPSARPPSACSPSLTSQRTPYPGLRLHPVSQVWEPEVLQLSWQGRTGRIPEQIFYSYFGKINLFLYYYSTDSQSIILSYEILTPRAQKSKSDLIRSNPGKRSGDT